MEIKKLATSLAVPLRWPAGQKHGPITSQIAPAVRQAGATHRVLKPSAASINASRIMSARDWYGTNWALQLSRRARREDSLRSAKVIGG